MRTLHSVTLTSVFLAVATSTSSLLLAAPPAPPAAPAATPQAPATQPEPRLKDIYKNDFLIGTALDFRSPTEFSPRELDIIKSQFSVITPENSMKPQIQPGPEQWNWTVADNLVNFCQQNNIKVHGHTLAWHAQTPNWFFTGDDGQPVTRDVAIARLKNHVMTEVGHYKGKMYSWDVVNEAINDSGPGTTENLRNSPWIRAIGPDYITMAFKWAHEADPDALLFYNDYNIERGNKHQSSLVLLKRLIADGAPINGVGIQGHWSLNNTPLADIDKAIADYKALGLKVAISELDITIAGQGGGQLNPATTGPATQGAPPFGRGRGAPEAPVAQGGGPAAGGPAGAAPGRRGRGGGGGGFGRGRGPAAPPTAEQLNRQAELYAGLFDIFQKHKDAVVRVTFWGLNDRRSWRAGQSPLLFDNNNDPKPALFSIAKAKQPG